MVSVTTPGNAYATTKAIATGSYTWTVTALDAGGKVLGTSLTGNFKVDATAPTLKSMKPTSKATSKSVFVATFSEKVKGVSKKTMRLFVKGSKKPLKAKVVITKGESKATLEPRASLEGQDLHGQVHRHPHQGRGRQCVGQSPKALHGVR